MALSTTPVTSISGNATGTTVTITLPTYSLSNYMVMFIASNNGNAQTISSAVTATVLANTTSSNRLIAYKLVPINSSQTTFTVTVAASSVFSWYIATFAGVDAAATVYATGNNIGNSTTSPVEIPVTTAGYIATGNELTLWAAGVNATGTWTTDSNTKFSSNTTSNASLMVGAGNMTAGKLSVAPAAMDRGLSGTSRNESALSLILQPTANNATPNLLTNPSFEAGTTIATGWTDEHTTAGSATYSLVTSPLTDGAKAQRFTYTGSGTDNGTKMTEIFQSPVFGMAVGDIVTFSVYLSGTLTNSPTIIGIEGFTTGNVYISETDTIFTSLTGTPTLYTVSYTCPPTNDHVAVFLQCQEIGLTSSVDVVLDNAILAKTTPNGNTTNFFMMF